MGRLASAGWSLAGAQRRHARVSQCRGDPKVSCGSTGHRLTNPSGRGGPPVLTLTRPAGLGPRAPSGGRLCTRPKNPRPRLEPRRSPSVGLLWKTGANFSLPSPPRYWGHHSSASDSAQRRATFRNPAKPSRAVTPASCDVITPFSDAP